MLLANKTEKQEEPTVRQIYEKVVSLQSIIPHAGPIKLPTPSGRKKQPDYPKGKARLDMGPRVPTESFARARTTHGTALVVFL